MSSRDNSSSNNGTCVVCYKNVEIYSIGMCDHPVCHECSTRMRVLCQQNECPICRGDLPNVVFTKIVKPYTQLRKSSLFDARYNVYFDNAEIQERFTRLLAHVCMHCKEPQVFSSFNSLKDHILRRHELHYCDLCVENLRIFSCERRCYSRPDLAHHRRKGDKDDKSHKGHPLCKFCDRRYMDNDELFRHLRKDHLYCHFCDADGLHHYYNTYDYLRDHFRNEHYLCEDGPCAEEQFTSVFRSDIDLKAHKATVHGKFLGKAAAKQARTLELEFTLAPRGENRVGNRRPGAALTAPGPSNSREYSSHGRDSSDVDSAFNPFDVEGTIRQPDVRSTEEFPSLGNAPVPMVNVTKKGRGNLTIRGTLGLQPPAVTDKNFPALGPESAPTSGLSKTVNLNVYSGNKPGQSRPQSSAPNLSIQVNHKTDGSITTRVSGPNIRIRPSTLSMDSDFPALGRSETASGTAANSNAGQWTKVTCVKSSGTSGSRGKHVAPALVLDSPPPASPTSFGEAFPSLPQLARSKNKLSISVAPNTSAWNPSTASENNEPPVGNGAAKANSKKKKKKKVKATTSGTMSDSTVKSNSSLPTKVQTDNQPSRESSGGKNKVNSQANSMNSREVDVKVDDFYHSSSKTISNAAAPRKRSELMIDNLNKSTNGSRTLSQEDFPVLGKLNPPPGFNAATPPPPGFAVKLNSLGFDRNDNGLTFTNSSGESYSIFPDKLRDTYSYISPPDFQKRNKHLVAKICEVLGRQESIEEFRYLSGLFRQGSCDAKDYYQRCRSVMGVSAFGSVFPEMLALLPDITKQRELFDLHLKEVGQIKSLEVCSSCGQIVKIGDDLNAHYSAHSLENNFPTLGKSTRIPSSTSWSARKGT